MDSGQDLLLALRQQRTLLIDCVDAMKVVGRMLAQATRDYKVALRKEILRLHVEDKVAWTACYDLALGEEKVAELRFNRDIKQSDYDVCQEKIAQIKLEIKILEGEIKTDLQHNY
ncbi:MAG: hypothetical protein N3I35_06615 [Clostridia bacterium]|nr:hypothetical protein [Clostridia bacterium]